MCRLCILQEMTYLHERQFQAVRRIYNVYVHFQDVRQITKAFYTFYIHNFPDYVRNQLARFNAVLLDFFVENKLRKRLENQTVVNFGKSFPVLLSQITHFLGSKSHRHNCRHTGAGACSRNILGVYSKLVKSLDCADVGNSL